MSIQRIFSVAVLLFIFLSLNAQVENAGTVRRNSNIKKETLNKDNHPSGATDAYILADPHDANLEYMKQVYRELDLEKENNAALYYPEDIVDGEENLFRIILKNVLNGSLTAYEFLDGKEIFSDQYKINPSDIVNRFDLYAHEIKGSTENNPKFEMEEGDVPVNQVTSYYIIEKWEFDNLSNSMKTKVTAICPVLKRYGDYGSESRYPMFWIKFDNLRPLLSGHNIYVGEDNNLPKYSLNDYFTLGLYDGDIYKISNPRNLSLSQMYPDEERLSQVRDSIDNHLRNYGKDLWVPTREEYLSGKNQNKDKNNGMIEDLNSENSEVKSGSSRLKKKSAKKQYKTPKNNSNSSAEKSVRRRKK